MARPACTLKHLPVSSAGNGQIDSSCLPASGSAISRMLCASCCRHRRWRELENAAGQIWSPPAYLAPLFTTILLTAEIQNYHFPPLSSMDMAMEGFFVGSTYSIDEHDDDGRRSQACSSVFSQPRSTFGGSKSLLPLFWYACARSVIVFDRFNDLFPGLDLW